MVDEDHLPVGPTSKPPCCRPLVSNSSTRGPLGACCATYRCRPFGCHAPTCVAGTQTRSRQQISCGVFVAAFLLQHFCDGGSADRQPHSEVDDVQQKHISGVRAA